MKKLSLGLASLILISSLSTINVKAADNDMQKKVYDTRKIHEKSFSPGKMSKGTEVTPSVVLPPEPGGPYWSATCGIYTLGGAWGKSISYTSSSKSSYYNIDHIAVKVRRYVGGGLTGTGTDDKYNSPIAGVDVQAGQGSFSDHETFANHTFEHSGYQSWYPDTYAT